MLCAKGEPIRHIPLRIVCYTAVMDNMMTIPKDRKPPKVGRFCLLIGLTFLIYTAVASHFGFATEMVGMVTRQGS